MKYPLAPNPIYWSIQGEGHLRGFQMAFLRLAGCSVGCPRCDTDYSVADRASVDDIVDRVLTVFPVSHRDCWVWITGGEPADHDLRPLFAGLRSAGCRVALATSGKHAIIQPVDWLSVSYHGGYPLRQQYGNEIKLIDGLNGLSFDRFLADYPDAQTDYFYRYVQPLSVDGREDPESVRRCVAWLGANPNWSMSRQDHMAWTVD